MKSPLFVVVGHVNRGKSSVVSTLAADASIEIDAMPGTTRQCRHYRMSVGEQTLLEFVDTPGFERPRHMLAWLRDHETRTAERAQVVWAFVDVHREGGAFNEECELVPPILEGGTILYVVDASRPPSVKEEAEMEILRWTGQPRMALLNRIGASDHSAAWRVVLDQYFNLVRTFDAQRADFEERIKLLRALSEVTEASREPLSRAIQILQADRRGNLEEAFAVVAELLVDVLTLTKQKRISVEVDSRPYQAPLSARYYDRIRDLESRSQERMKEIFGHGGLLVEQDPLAEIDDDLFDLSLWNHLGLTSAQLITTGAATGAAAGGAIDLAVSGTALGAGLLVGAAVGGGASWYASRSLPKVKVRGIPLGGQMLQIGPMSNREFPWVLLDRCLLLLDLVARQPHASRQQVTLPSTSSRRIVSTFPAALRNRYDRVFTRLRKVATVEEIEREKMELMGLLLEWWEQHETSVA